MPTFTAIALDRLLEQASSNSAADSNLDRRNSATETASGVDFYGSRPISVPNRILLPPPRHKPVRRESSSSDSAAAEEKKAQWPHISPALYATPESTPLPDSPTSFPPSPYIINRKRRGPRLQKSSSEASMVKGKAVDEEDPGSCHLSDTEIETKSSSAADDVVVTESDCVVEEKVNGFHGEQIRNGVVSGLNGEAKDSLGSNSFERDSEVEDFFDPQETMSFTSNTDGEVINTDQSARESIPSSVFYDAWEELSSDTERQPKSYMHDLETEFHEMRLSLLMEAEKRKQAEDALNNMRSQWQNLREKLREAGLVLPTYLSTIAEDEQMKVDSMEDICQQVYITRFVSESIGRAAARAECEEEMEAHLESKNFEIARLSDRLHYYEIMNHEMSHRNQEAIEIARRDRQRRRKVQTWVWGSIFATITLGSTALAWSYLNAKGSSSSHQLHAAELDTSTE